MTVLLVTPLGCSGATNNAAPRGEDAETTSEQDGAGAVDPGAMDEVDRAVAVAKEIMRSPEEADEILARYDLDRVGLDELVYKIASDPGSRRRYSEQLTARD
jgi:hypothetical protein